MSLSDGGAERQRLPPQRHHGNNHNRLARVGNAERWGDDLSERLELDDDTFRICCCNVNGIPADSEDNKNKRLFDAISKFQIDAFTMTEVNIRPDKLQPEEQLSERYKGFFEHSHLQLAYNYHEVTESAHQYGGTGIWAIDQAAHRYDGAGVDPTGMGRWNWMTFLGRNGIIIRIVSIYIPKGSQNSGHDTVYKQQGRVLAAMDRDIDPIDALWADFLEEMNRWHTAGDTLIVLGDFNDDVRGDALTFFFRRFNMREIIMHDRGRAEAARAPNTWEYGSDPIDGIFMSRSIKTIASGYLCPGEIPGDHRPVWIDVEIEHLFGQRIPLFISPRARRLQLGNTKSCKKWRKLFRKHINKHKLPSLIYHLQENCSTPMTEEHQKLYNRIDTIMHEGVIFADKKCRKLCMGQVPYTPALSKLGSTIELWKNVIRRKNGARIDTGRITRLEKESDITNSLSVSLTTAEESLQAAKDEWKLAKETAAQDRKTFFETKAEDMESEGLGQKAKILKRLLREESQRISARRINSITHSQRKGAIGKIQVPRENDTWETVTQKDDIERGCLQEARERFTQSEGTPLLEEPMLSEVGIDGFGPATEDILNGTYTPPDGIDGYTRELLQEFKRLDNLPQYPIAISTEEYIKGWSKMKERTSSGPSGIHFGHFKACTLDKDLADFMCTMSNIPYATGFTPDRWKKGLNVFLEKASKSDMVTKLRIILLYEADFNHNNKLLGREALYRAQQQDGVAQEQHGSAFSAIEHGMNKRLTFDIMRQTKSPGALCSNDAKSCYDRIIHSALSLALQRVGVPEGPIKSMLQAIRELKHYCRTAYGDSERCLDATTLLEIIHGVGQGNGAGPSIWALLSTPLLNLLRRKGFGAHFISALTKELLHIVGYAYVDDTDIVQLARSTAEDFLSVAQNLQQALDWWEGGLKTTGGALDPLKSFWYPIDFTWNGTEWSYVDFTQMDNPPEITIKDATDQQYTLRSLPPHKSKKTLGCYLAPNGNNAKAAKKLIEKGEDWRDKIRTKRLPSDDAWRAVHSTILKSIQFPLPAMTFTQDECKAIMKPIKEGSLPAQGICRNVPLAVLHAPSELQGFDFPDLYVDMCTSQLQLLLQHSFSSTSITGSLLRNSFESLKLEAGIGGSPFQSPFDRYGRHVTYCWHTHLWNFLTLHEYKVKDTLPHLQLHREHDQFIMECFIAEGYSKEDLKILNGCRLYLQVTTLSDITTGDGRYITDCIMQGDKDDTRMSQYSWPRQGVPRPDEWAIWQRAIVTTFCVAGRSLLRPLGDWTNTDLSWRFTFSPRINRIYEQMGPNEWKVYTRLRQRGPPRRHPLYNYSGMRSQTPVNAQRCTIQQVSAHTIALTGWAGIQVPIPTLPPLNFISFLRSNKAPVWMYEVILNDNVENMSRLRSALLAGTTEIVSDGSFFPASGTATAAIVIASPTCDRPLVIQFRIPGRHCDQTPYRAELGGIYVTLAMLDYLLQYLHLTDQTTAVSFGCDGESALQAAFQKFPSPKKPDFDLVSAIHTLHKKCRSSFSWQHVKGHQDDDPNSILDRWARLNIMADYYAKLHNGNTIAQPSFDVQLEGEMWSVYRPDGTKVTSYLKETVTKEITSLVIKEYWSERHRLNPATDHLVDYSALKKSMKRATIKQKKFRAKFACDWTGVRGKMFFWKTRSNRLCQECNAGAKETSRHSIICRNPASSLCWYQQIGLLQAWMLKQDAHPGLCNVVCTALNAWKGNIPQPAIPPPHPCHRAMICQNRIGWANFLEGLVSHEWSKIQDKHFKDKGSRKTGSKWMSRLITRMWEMITNIWKARQDRLHDREQTAITAEIQLLDRHITIEFARGLGRINQRWHSYFRGTVEELLAQTITQRKKWYESVIRLREQYHGASVMTRQREFLYKWLIDKKGR